VGKDWHDRQTRTNIRRTARAITQKITGWGFDVYISYSHSTKSRYFKFKLRDRRRIEIRLSDHPSVRRWKYDYDVYTDQPRQDAIDYLTLISLIENRLFKGKERKMG
jgi:hypothetical protein